MRLVADAAAGWCSDTVYVAYTLPVCSSGTIAKRRSPDGKSPVMTTKPKSSSLVSGFKPVCTGAPQPLPVHVPLIKGRGAHSGHNGRTGVGCGVGANVGDGVGTS